MTYLYTGAEALPDEQGRCREHRFGADQPCRVFSIVRVPCRFTWLRGHDVA